MSAIEIREHLADYAESLDKQQRESKNGISMFRMQYNIALEALNNLNETELYMFQKMLNAHMEEHLG